MSYLLEWYLEMHLRKKSQKDLQFPSHYYFNHLRTGWFIANQLLKLLFKKARNIPSNEVESLFSLQPRVWSYKSVITLQRNLDRVTESSEITHRGQFPIVHR